MAIIDLVSWAPQGNQTIYAYRFPQTNLSTYSQLIVQESQEAILFSKGQIVGKFGPGKHTLNTENIPILRSLYGLPFSGKNPFTAEVWFVNKVQPYNIDWSIDRMDIHDADYNTGIPIVANGRYGLKINDAERFLIKIVGTKNSFDQNDLTDQFFGEFSTKTKSTVSQFMIKNRIGLKQISAHLDSISEHLKTVMSAFWENIGLELTKFYVTSIEVDKSNEVGRRILDAISRQSAQSIGGYTWQQEQVFGVANNAIDGLSNSNSGILGAVIATNMMGGLAAAGGLMQPQPQYNRTTADGIPNNTYDNNHSPTSQPKEVYCSNCSKKFANTHSFCPHCGDSYDACPNCGTDNDKQAKRCVSCGINLLGGTALCTNCNNPLTSNASFCGTCGQQQGESKCKRCQNSLHPNVKFCPTCGLKR
jgi:membrane protease subunit (stomatin/prohibitin family)